MISERQIDKLCDNLGLDRLSAWRYLRDQEILRRQYKFKLPSRYQEREGNSE
jgi:hypothetical protein